MSTATSRSQVIIEHAQRYIPGGVSSANRLVEPNLVFTRAQGAYIFDAEGKRYILIFDEVITGFRHGLGGYQEVIGVTPDLTTMAKAIANGYPLAVLAGRADLLEHCRPGGEVFFAGTFNAHPAGVAAALATIEILERPDSYVKLFSLGERMREGLREIVHRLCQ